MGVPRIKSGPMTVEEFYAFTDTRPDEEKWELIDGEPILNAAPSRLHQRIVKNLLVTLGAFDRQTGVAWETLPGLGVRVSDTNRPEPDVLIMPKDGDSLDPLGRDRSDVIVAFEVLSPSTRERDLRWKRSAYTSLPSLTHYVVIAQDAVEVVVFARDAGFAERRLRSLRDLVELPALGVSLPLSEIYRDTGLIQT
jgi:Uma2 family endonuclease